MRAPEPPFRPRLRRGAWLRGLRKGRASGPRMRSRLALLAVAATLFCFWRVFAAFGGVTPASEPGAESALTQAKGPLLWFLLGTACAALIPLAMQRHAEPKATLKPGALRETARDAAAWVVRKVGEKRRGAARATTGAAETEGADGAPHGR